MTRGWKHPCHVDVYLTLRAARESHPHIRKFKRVFAGRQINHPTLGVIIEYTERRK